MGHTLPDSLTARTIADAYTEFRAFMDSGRNTRTRQTRKLSHNTWIRREHDDTTNADSFVITFHATDILTYHSDGTMSLCANGWHTATTAKRFRDYLPALWSVSNHRGMWNVYGPTGKRVERTDWRGDTYTLPEIAPLFVFWDGMRITDTHGDTERAFCVNYTEAPNFGETRHTLAAIERLAHTYAATYDREYVLSLSVLSDAELSEMARGDCLYCQMSMSEDPEHVALHVFESYRQLSLIRNAYTARGYTPFAAFWAIRNGDYRGIRQTVRKYVLGVLAPHNVPAVTQNELHALRLETETHAA